MLTILLVLAGLGYLNYGVYLADKEMEENPDTPSNKLTIAVDICCLPIRELALKPVGRLLVGMYHGVYFCVANLLKIAFFPALYIRGKRVLQLKAKEEVDLEFQKEAELEFEKLEEDSLENRCKLLEKNDGIGPIAK